MIESDLLFSVAPISSLYVATWWDFLIVALFLLGAFITIKKHHSLSIPVPSRNLREKSYTIPHIDDADFEEKIARILRLVIGYPSTPADAHTASEISHYSAHPLISVLKMVEQIEYRGKRLSEVQKREILDALR